MREEFIKVEYCLNEEVHKLSKLEETDGQFYFSFAHEYVGESKDDFFIKYLLRLYESYRGESCKDPFIWNIKAELDSQNLSEYSTLLEDSQDFIYGQTIEWKTIWVSDESLQKLTVNFLIDEERNDNNPLYKMSLIKVKVFKKEKKRKREHKIKKN